MRRTIRNTVRVVVMLAAMTAAIVAWQDAASAATAIEYGLIAAL